MSAHPPEVQAFLDSMKARRGATGPSADDSSETTPEAPEFLTEVEDPSQTIVIEPLRRGVTGIYCPQCDFLFERTSVAHGRDWAQEHNARMHDDQLLIADISYRR